MAITIQEMAVQYLNYLKHDLEEQEKQLAQQQDYVNQLRKHIAECEQQLVISQSGPAQATELPDPFKGGS